MENYILVQMECLGFLDSYLISRSSQNKLVGNQNKIPIRETLNCTDDLLKPKLAYPYEFLIYKTCKSHYNLKTKITGQH